MLVLLSGFDDSLGEIMQLHVLPMNLLVPVDNVSNIKDTVMVFLIVLTALMRMAVVSNDVRISL